MVYLATVLPLALRILLEDGLVDKELEHREITGNLDWDPAFNKLDSLIPLSCDLSSSIARQVSETAQVLRYGHLS
jgi:hypothetical protein